MVAPGWAKRLPPSASIKPAAILSKVDLPEPLRPTRQSRSPSPTLSSAPSNSRWPPNATVISLRCKTGAMGGYVLGLAAAIKKNLARLGRNHRAGARFHLQRRFRVFRQRFAIKIEHPDIALDRTLHQEPLAVVAPHRALAGMTQLGIGNMIQLALADGEQAQFSEHAVISGRIANRRGPIADHQSDILAIRRQHHGFRQRAHLYCIG